MQTLSTKDNIKKNYTNDRELINSRTDTQILGYDNELDNPQCRLSFFAVRGNQSDAKLTQ